MVLVLLFAPFISIVDDWGVESTQAPQELLEQSSKNPEVETRKAVALFGDILTDLRLGYVDEVDPKRLFETGVGAMLRSLDPYTEFENVKQSRAIKESVSGRYGGVGLIIANEPQPKVAAASPVSKLAPPAGASIIAPAPPPSDVIAAPVPGNGNGVSVVDAFESYAFKGGMRVGDHILSVDGVPATGLSVEGVRDLLRGDPDTKVRVKFEREEYNGRKEYEVMLSRAAVKLSDVRLASFLGDANDKVGYINLAGFNAEAARDFRSALLMLKYSAQENHATEGGLRGLVLDLRSNPGGLLDAAVEIASYLVPNSADIVSARSRGGPEITYRSVSEPLLPKNTKLVVLVNGGSASASEIVAGAVQDLDAGVIMGQSKTYGKGLVQKILPLSYDSALKYTVAKYFTPSGRCIQAVAYSGGREVPTDGTSAAASGGEETAADAEAEAKGSPIADKDRRVFYTANGRPVLDGGGITPDEIVPPNQLAPSEALFLGQGLYSEFVSKYVQTHDVLPALRDATALEYSTREEDFRYNHGAFGPAVEQFLVLDGPDAALGGWSKSGPTRTPLIRNAELYRDFKEFVRDQVKEKKVALKLAAVPKLEEIKKVPSLPLSPPLPLSLSSRCHLTHQFPLHHRHCKTKA
jgi:carboxyl-terminal processing protease